MQFRYCLLAIPLFAALALPVAAAAVELGDAHMRSFIGQPLSADIELTGLASDSAPVQAAVADADVYRGASIAMHPALASANITTFRRDGRRYLHISSSTAMKADHLPIFFTLSENGQKSVRQVTLWLTPDPNPAPPPAPAPAPVPATPAPVVMAAAVSPAVVAAAPAVVAAVAHPTAVAATIPKVVLTKVVPALPFLPAPSSVRHAVTLPRATPAAACAVHAPASDAASCAALDAKNLALTTHLAELEDKVKQLSAALQGGVAAAAPAHAAVPVPAAKPLPAKLVPMGSKPPPDTGRPYLVIAIVAALILALVAGLGFVLLRQRRKARRTPKAVDPVAADVPAAPVVKPSFIASVKNRLMPGRAAPAARVEPGEAVNTVPAL